MTEPLPNAECTTAVDVWNAFEDIFVAHAKADQLRLAISMHCRKNHLQSNEFFLPLLLTVTGKSCSTLEDAIKNYSELYESRVEKPKKQMSIQQGKFDEKYGRATAAEKETVDYKRLLDKCIATKGGEIQNFYFVKF
jgi:hypothetical protein